MRKTADIAEVILKLPGEDGGLGDFQQAAGQAGVASRRQVILQSPAGSRQGCRCPQAGGYQPDEHWSQLADNNQEA